jgi:hypothetical protein
VYQNWNVNPFSGSRFVTCSRTLRREAYEIRSGHCFSQNFIQSNLFSNEETLNRLSHEPRTEVGLYLHTSHFFKEIITPPLLHTLLRCDSPDRQHIITSWVLSQNLAGYRVRMLSSLKLSRDHHHRQWKNRLSNYRLSFNCRSLEAIVTERVRSLILLKVSALDWLTFPFSHPFHENPTTSITTDTPSTRCR